ncbi:MAG: hypothetical protein ACRD4S_08190 [Candidatus Acidiferrales bacterium]
MRAIILLFLLNAAAAAPAFSATANSCPGGVPVTGFRLIVMPPAGEQALPLLAVNVIHPGQVLRYEPYRLPKEISGRAEVAVLFVPAAQGDNPHIEVLPSQPADQPAEWKVPIHASVVGFVFGPHGLDVKKINSLMEKNPELISKLTDYIEESSKVEALVQTLSQFESSAPGSTNFSAVLGHFSAQYGVALPNVDASAPSGQQAEQLLHSVLPAFSSSDPLTSGPSLRAQSTGLAASVATLFFGAGSVGLAAGGAQLIEEMHATMFPHAEFRTAFAQEVPDGMSLCSPKSQHAAKEHTRLVYLWMLNVPDSAPPAIALAAPANIPAGWVSTLKVSCASVAQLKNVTRIRGWELLSADAKTSVAVPVKVTLGSVGDLLTLDLSKTRIPPGEYHLAAKWDWTPIEIAGEVDVHKFADYSTAVISPTSRDELISGRNAAPLRVDGADFEFLDKVTLVDKQNPKAPAMQVSFRLPKGTGQGEQHDFEANVDTRPLPSGNYLLELRQLNGASHDVPVAVHPANPQIRNLPLRVNVGESQQIIHLQGTDLERIDRIASPDVRWTLSPIPVDSHGLSDREATIQLGPKARKGDQIAASLFINGLEEPLKVLDVLAVAGPRPKIADAKASFATSPGVELKPGEIPAGSPVSFSISPENITSQPSLQLACAAETDTKRSLALSPGERVGSDELDLAGEGLLYLSIDPGDVGQSGCLLIATLTEPAAGVSDPYLLGRVVRLPRIDTFTLSGETLGQGLYAGALTGQDLQTIEKTGWTSQNGENVPGIATPVPSAPGEQTLKIAMHWPPPSPHAPIYVWLRGETQARLTNAHY